MSGDNNDRNLPHIHLTKPAKGFKFTNPGSGGGNKATFPVRDRIAHADRLARQLEAIRQRDGDERVQREAVGLPTDYGLVLEFISHPGFDLTNKSLERRSAQISLLNIRTQELPQHDGIQETREYATVRIPFGQISVFEKLISNYRDKDTVSKDGKTPKPRNEPLIAPIDDIRRATLDAFWTDRRSIPSDDNIEVMWEAWLRTGETPAERDVILGRFRDAAQQANARILGRPLLLPETTILLIQAKRAQLQSSVDLLDCLCELRAPAEGAGFFDDMTPTEQAAWVSAATDQLHMPSPDANAVCLLDTGLNHGHPLLAPIVPADGLHTYLPAWGTDDKHANNSGHGTQMAGLAAYGDLTPVLATATPPQATHWIESGKIFNDRDPIPQDQWGNVVADTVASVEQAAPKRRRVFAQQITACDNVWDGRPTSWSAATDQLCAAANEDPSLPRLLFISAGNWPCETAVDYPAINRGWSIHDPAQAWNAVTVGACTHKDRILDPAAAHLPAVAPRGGLSPMSATSCPWASDWPLKPDIVFEGGNRINDDGTLFKHPDLELLTTNAAFSQRLLCTVGDTSSASAQAARIAALVQGEYPGYWPETIRALMAHSAEWTPAMRDGYNLQNKTDVADLIRHYGHGEPSALRALRTARSAVTLVIQDQFHPFIQKEKGDKISTNEMRFHSLPWPKAALEGIATANVELRITLSYFIEPNPGPRLTNDRYRYGSCHLRFDVQRPTESAEKFCERINGEERQSGYSSPRTGDSDHWTIGSDARHRGSLHQDTWIGPAADLASKSCIAVYPVSGWWRLRPHLRRYENSIRYALIVSLRSPEQPVDLHTPIISQIKVPAPPILVSS